MTSMILVVAVILIAIVGVAFLAYRMLSGNAAVAISDVDEINRAKMEYFAQQKVAYDPYQTPTSVNYEETAILKDQIMTLEDENSKLRKEIFVLQKEKSDLQSTKDKLQESNAFIQQLKADNDKLQNTIMEQTRKCNELTEDIERISAELDSSNSQESLGVEIWEKEIADLKAEKEELLQAKVELEQLKRNSDLIEDQEDKISKRYKRLVERFTILRRRSIDQKEESDLKISKLEYENELLVGKIRLMEERNIDMEKELESMRTKSGKMFGIHSLEEILDQQKVILEQSKKSLEGRSETIKALDSLENEKNELFAQNTVLRSNYEKLKEMNEYLVEKEKILQYELTKSRAHSLGLEKVCEGLTEHLDSLNI